jgi:eukaryotic-like serine/threonine-protein kinase
MTLATGTRLGSYEVLAPIGEGGMGEVYRARDTRLDRDVAIKILPELFAADPDRLMRFEREAKALAALNHPNIAHVYGVEESPGGRALVMEFVEGEDLAQQLARGPLPVDQALAVAREVAAALEAAHEAGIVHRDLKPANLKVRADGTVKVLDFGLAKATEPTRGGADAAHSPTFTSPALTQMGVLLGTAAYMAPEQARGKAVDKRADIWAFGCVLYELLTGRVAFAGETITDSLAAIMTRDLDLDALPAGTPPGVRRLLARCLERDPKQRLRDIGEARIALDPGAFAHDPASAGVVAASMPSRGRTWLWLGAMLAAVTATGFLAWQARAPADPPLRRFMVPTPGDATPQAAAISPDGDAIAFVAGERVWLQRLDQFTPVEVASSAGANAVFWSPDGAFVGFQARGQLWRMAVAGGAPIAIGRVPQEFTAAGGVAWLEDGRIVFTTGGTGLLQVPAEGGTATPLLEIDPDTEADFHNVSALPGGRGLLFVQHPAAESQSFRIELFIPSDGSRRIVHERGPNVGRPIYSPTGHVLFEQAGGVWMVPFSLDQLQPSGTPTLLMADARAPSVSRDGTLVMLPGNRGSADARLTWVDHSGTRGATLGQTNLAVAHPRISPDGRLVAATVGAGDNADIWVFDVERGTDRRLTFESGRDALPSWTPDSGHVVYHCGTSVCARRADGTGARIELVDNALPVSPAVVSPDARWLVFVRETRPAVPDLWIVELPAGGPTTPVTATPRPLIRGERLQRNPDISPDGRFIAYVSSEEGVFAVYVSRFPEGDGKWEVSRGFGAWPRWAPAGDALYFSDGLSRIARMEVDPSAAFQPGPIAARIPVGGAFAQGFDVSADAQRVLLPLSPGEQGRPGSLLVVQNWRP